MAQEFSSHYLKSLRFRQLPALHFRIYARLFIKAARWLERRMAVRAPKDAMDPTEKRELITSTLEKDQAALRSDGWAFSDDILDTSFHARLLAGWPKRCYMTPASDLLKSWDRGFGWRRGHTHDPEFLDRHPALRDFFGYLRSEGFGRRFTALVGTEDVSCYSFVTTMTIPGSVVAPHRDDWAFLEQGPKTAYNLVFFIDGSGGSRSGGLSILGTNDFNQVIFESPRLRNTALIYDAKAPFYHGFQPVERSKFRWAIISNFVSSNWGSRT